MDKPEKYEYYRNSRNKITYKEWPKEVKDYYNWQRRNRMNPKWKGLSDEERKKKKLEVVANNRSKWYEKYNNMSQEEKEKINKKKGNFWNNADDEKKEDIRKLLTKRSNDFWESMNEKERKDFGQYRWNLKTDEEKEEIVKRLNEAGINHMKNLPEEEMSKWIEKMNKARLDKMDEDPEFRNRQINSLRCNCENYWNNITEKERAIIIQKEKDRWINMPEDEKKKYSDLTTKRNNEWWASRTPEQLKEISARMKDWSTEFWNNLSTEEKADIRRKILTKNSGIGRSSLHDKFERYFKSSYLINDYYYKSEEVLNNNEIVHSWDYGIYNLDNKLMMVVDLDGRYFHGDNSDYNGYHSREEYDEKRFLSVPINIKYHIINEDSWKKSFENMIKMLMLNYDDFIAEQFKMCRYIPGVPYPHFKDEDLYKSYDQLLKLKCDDKYHESISLNNREGDRLINHFHHSIYSAKRNGTISPYDAWYDDELLKKVIENRILYINTLNPNKILQGFNISKIAQKVSVFSAGRAKLLINKYLYDMNEIFDPFSGFSGRMLGTISLNKRYIGQDISEIHIRESSNILEFLKSIYKFDVYLTEKNILQSSGEYQSLFTCPPYGDKEQWLEVPVDKRSCDDWIDECLKRFICKKYLFVVDETIKYQDYIVDEITNKSHFGINKEYVILIDNINNSLFKIF